jgi:hypothetical protein
LKEILRQCQKFQIELLDICIHLFWNFTNISLNKIIFHIFAGLYHCVEVPIYICEHYKSKRAHIF